MKAKPFPQSAAGCARLAALVLVSSLVLSASVAAQEAAPAADADHQPPVPTKISALAHRVLEAGLKTNALAGDGLKPWHLKIDYEMHSQVNSKPKNGTLEEWHAGPNQWRRTFTGPEQGMNGSEWSVSKLERYETKAEQNYVGRRLVTLRIARPVIDPMYQAANVKPGYEMDVQLAKAGALTLNCVSVVNARQYAEETNPDWLFPTMCFDKDLHLRATNAGDTSVEFDDLQPFQNRVVARDVKVIVNGTVNAEMKVSLLEPWDASDDAVLKPGKDAVAEPYEIEPGHPLPESVYEVAAHLPLRPDGYPYTGSVPIPILIRKDGSLQIVHFDSPMGPRDLIDSVELAVAKWKYKPYLVDGEPVEVRSTAIYPLDQKPFVPSYARPKAGAVDTAPDDYSSAFDPKRDPDKDLAMAKAAAAAGNKRILMEVGGSWCSWCAVMDKFFIDHAEMRALRDANFVFMKVNMGPTNENPAFLGRFPKIPAYPYLFVLDSDGKLLQTKNTDELEEGKSYSVKQLEKFISSATAH